MSILTTILPFQPATMSTAQQAGVSYLARHAGRIHALYAFQLREDGDASWRSFQHPDACVLCAP